MDNHPEDLELLNPESPAYIAEMKRGKERVQEHEELVGRCFCHPLTKQLHEVMNVH